METEHTSGMQPAALVKKSDNIPLGRKSKSGGACRDGQTGKIDECGDGLLIALSS